MHGPAKTHDEGEAIVPLFLFSGGVVENEDGAGLTLQNDGEDSIHRAGRMNQQHGPGILDNRASSVDVFGIVAQVSSVPAGAQIAGERVSRALGGVLGGVRVELPPTTSI